MELKRMMPLAIVVSIAMVAVSCKYNPWISGDSSTDIVTITKTTRIFGKVSPGETVPRSQVGAVKMSHKVHEENGVACIVCHHKKYNPERIKTCAKCHTGEEGYKTMHTLCIGCHIKLNKGPQQCKQCH